ncbi:MAG TPA: Gfo/Idh/MocA family oxidoreductase [Bacteroidota bacterium]|nr:Gfo/Idh/MocA family oxidoreductase [Bacteroidota bacterium]
MKTLNAAVIGTGFIGPAHIEALRRTGGVRIAALCSNERARTADLAARFDIPRVYDRWEQLVADPEVDVVHNCTPNNLHYAINRAALLAGKHVVSEKPLTMTCDESAALVKLARRTGSVNAVNYNYRFYPLIQQCRSMVRRGEIGDVYLVHGHYLQDWLFHATDFNWRVEPAVGGVSRTVADIGTHWCDLVQFITGRHIRRVSALLRTVHPVRTRPAGHDDTFKGKETGRRGRGTRVRIRTEDAAVILFELDGGAAGTVTVSQVSAGRKNREWFEIDGSRGAIAWDQENPNELWLGRRDSPNGTMIKDPALLDRDARPYAHYPGGHPEGYPDGPLNLFMNVYEFIRAGRDPRREQCDFPTFADGHRENRIVEAVLASDASRRWVNVKS